MGGDLIKNQKNQNLEPKPHSKLRAAMDLTGHNQETLSKALGMSLSAFSLKINGKREFTLSECNLISKKIGKTLDEIFFTGVIPKQETKSA